MKPLAKGLRHTRKRHLGHVLLHGAEGAWEFAIVRKHGRERWRYRV